MIVQVALWGHILAALSFGVLAAAQASIARNQAQRIMLSAACAATALWAIAIAGLGPLAALAAQAETLRNVLWLAFMYLLLRRGEGPHRTWSISAIYAALALVATAQSGIGLLSEYLPSDGGPGDAVAQAAFVMRMIFAVGALVLVHNLYSAADSSARAGIGLPMTVLTALWAYDLNLYTLSYLAREPMAGLLAARGLAVAALAPVMALAARRNSGWTIRLSRTVAFRSLSLVAVAGYLLAMVSLSALLDAVGTQGAELVQVAFLIFAAVAAIVLLPSKRVRAWARVMLAKHMFAHRYDYRAEWLRFTDTLGRPGDGPAPLNERVVKAIADITESPSGVLLVPEDSGLVSRSGWNWTMESIPAFIPGEELLTLLGQGRIVEIDPIRDGDSGSEAEARVIPAWIVADPANWAIIPLIHFDKLAGAVLLARPLLARTLDWEDFDLLRVAGRQVASYLAEAQGQEKLSDAQRFDEFNRRFAFIMHDIKNLVSQLTLVTRNAERHADKPEFRADMIATLQSSTARMNDLLARLSQHNTGKPEEARAVALGPLVTAIAAAKRAQHPVVLAGNMALSAMADASRLEAAVGHLIQNAIDASPHAEPVTVTLVQSGDQVGIEIEDKGCGMTNDFVRTKLFRPFASTKDGGFGIGAFEARAIVVAMQGRMIVESDPGRGSRFTVWFAAPRRWQEALVA